MFICSNCHNKDLKYIGYKNGIPYCRKCILQQRGKMAVNREYFNRETIKANINYNLTKTQSEASNKIYEYVTNKKSCIVSAVTGAGKTELVYKSIEYFLNRNMKIAFAIPRKDVVKEIYCRLKHDYSNIKMCCVYGGHTSNIEGQLIVLTTHQLFRYKHYFDLLILDEADAFPYYNDELLETYLNDSCKGVVIYLSATIKEKYLKICPNVIEVNRRFHNHDLPVPEFIKYNLFNKVSVLKELLKSFKNKKVLIFVPTIKEGNELSKNTNLDFVCSISKNRDSLINSLKEGKTTCLITTTILERGITVRGIQVIVYEANHKLFDEASLVQIAGRVGRKISDPTGKVYFLATNMSESMKKCIKEIKSKNETKE